MENAILGRFSNPAPTGKREREGRASEQKEPSDMQKQIRNSPPPPLLPTAANTATTVRSLPPERPPSPLPPPLRFLRAGCF